LSPDFGTERRAGYPSPFVLSPRTESNRSRQDLICPPFPTVWSLLPGDSKVFPDRFLLPFFYYFFSRFCNKNTKLRQDPAILIFWGTISFAPVFLKKRYRQSSTIWVLWAPKPMLFLCSPPKRRSILSPLKQSSGFREP